MIEIFQFVSQILERLDINPDVAGRYQHAKKKDLLFFGASSRTRSSRESLFNLRCSEGSGKLSFTYKTTPPPFKSRSFLNILYSAVETSESPTFSSSLVSHRPSTSMSLPWSNTLSLCLCFRNDTMLRKAILRPFLFRIGLGLLLSFTSVQ